MEESFPKKKQVFLPTIQFKTMLCFISKYYTYIVYNIRTCQRHLCLYTKTVCVWNRCTGNYHGTHGNDPLQLYSNMNKLYVLTTQSTRESINYTSKKKHFWVFVLYFPQNDSISRFLFNVRLKLHIQRVTILYKFILHTKIFQTTCCCCLVVENN